MNQAKPIRLSMHTLEHLDFRGANTSEIEKAIRIEKWNPVEHGRLECRMKVPFNAIWNGRYYAFKIVRPIFVEEPDEIFNVTVYTYFTKE
jgi:hypothetical protein